jgi:hypothetical protein
MSPFTCPSPRESLTFARLRDERVCFLLGSHPVTAAQLVALGWFPSRNKALRRLRRLVARKRIRVVGTVCRKTGRPEHVFCRYRPKSDSLLHEVELTELCLRLDAGRILRGRHVTDERRPDAQVWINDRLFCVELDRGTMGYTQITRRFQVYEGSKDLVLWVCSTLERADGFRQRAEKIRSIALFTTFAKALATPHDEIWRDYAGNAAALPREE